MLPLFIVDQIPDRGELTIGGEEARHAMTVMRLEISEQIEITDGRGRRARVEVVSGTKREFTVNIIEVREVPSPRTKLIVIQALTKGDRARETVEMLTEGGVTEIVPWQAARSIGNWRGEREALDKWRLWAREATKQSRRSWVPEVSELLDSPKVLERVKSSAAALLFHEADGRPLSQVKSTTVPSEITLIIGPEGGITPEETDQFRSAGAIPVTMGEPILRSAHAGLAALAAVQTSYGIW